MLNVSNSLGTNAISTLSAGREMIFTRNPHKGMISKVHSKPNQPLGDESSPKGKV